jgi:hypothetical protein
MSLQLAAQHLSDQGRGPDSMLVHMSRNEVKSLNDLAMAHGGHLTINPDTGLPEAGFLNKLLPAIIGAGLTVATGGAAAPWMIGLGVGGVETLRTGDIKKGVMAGLGAYGGAGLGAGISAAGNSAVSEAASAANPSFMGPMPGAATGMEAAKAGISGLGTEAGRSAFMGQMGGGMGLASTGMQAFGPAIADALDGDGRPDEPVNNTPASPLRYNYGTINPNARPDVPEYGNLGQDFGRQQTYFPDAGYKASTTEERGFAGGGPIEMMSDANSIGANTGYPMADINKGAYATPYQTPIPRNVVGGTSDTGVNPMTGDMQFARGGLSDLGDYSDGGRLLRGPGDGVSDSIPAQIGAKQPARLADGEFVVPARIVSELGNGSTEAGARKLYAMMDRVQKARGKTVGKGKIAKNSRAERHLPA